jgi:hypothetical protein
MCMLDWEEGRLEEGEHHGFDHWVPILRVLPRMLLPPSPPTSLAPQGPSATLASSSSSAASAPAVTFPYSSSTSSPSPPPSMEMGATGVDDFLLSHGTFSSW